MTNPNPYGQPGGDPYGPRPDYNPGGPAYGPGPQQFAATQPQAPQKSSGPFKTMFLGCLGVIVAGLVLFGGCAVLGGALGEVDPTASPDTVVDAGEGKDAEESKTPEARRTKTKPSEAAAFKACVKKDGTAVERKAVAKVTKVTGVETTNNILDNAEVWTTLSGGLMGPDQSTAKIIASAFGTCYKSDNGLVTVYGEDGEMLANGNF